MFLSINRNNLRRMVAIFLAAQKSCRGAKQTSQVDPSLGAGQCLPLLETDVDDVAVGANSKRRCFPSFLLMKNIGWRDRHGRKVPVISTDRRNTF